MEEKAVAAAEPTNHVNVTSSSTASYELHAESLHNSELDNLLAKNETHNIATPIKPLHSTRDEFLTLEKLSNEIEETVDSSSSQRVRPINFSAPDILVPHVSYELLNQVTDNFSDAPYQAGGSRLGAGAYGVVYKAALPMHLLIKKQNANDQEIILDTNYLENTTQEDTKEIAIKKLNFSGGRVDEQFKVEVEMLSSCNHPNLLSLEGYSCDGPHWCLMYAYMVYGNLQDRLSCTADTQPLTPQQRLVIGHGTAKGLAYLHTFRETPMIHRDVKSANILLDEHFLPKLGDFGLLRIGSRGAHTETLVKTTTVFGTSAYMAPEAFRGDVSTKLDTFSYGVVLLELLTGLPPYDEHRDGRDLLSHIEGADDTPDSLCDSKGAPWPNGLPKALLDLAMLCFDDKKSRPSMIDVVRKWQPLVDKWTGFD